MESLISRTLFCFRHSSQISAGFKDPSVVCVTRTVSYGLDKSFQLRIFGGGHKMDRIVKYLWIIMILVSSVMLIMLATDSDSITIIDGLLIGTGAISIVVVLWYLFLPNWSPRIRIKTMRILFVLLIIMACEFYIGSKIDLWEARQIEKARLQQNPALIENH